MKKPLVSFIVPVYNKAQTLPQSLQSIFDQSISEFEVICVDDASTDQSQSLLSTIKESRLKKIFLPVNGGVVKAYAEGVKRASGKYVLFHDSDDMSLPDRAEKCLNAIGDADVLYHGIYLISRHPEYLITSRRYFPAAKWEEKKIFQEQYLPGVICAKRSLLKKITVPKEAYWAWDWMHHILLHLAGAQYKALDEGLYEYYRYPKNSLSYTNEMEGRRQVSVKWIQRWLKQNGHIKRSKKFSANAL